jgi:hypothetical protein
MSTETDHLAHETARCRTELDVLMQTWGGRPALAIAEALMRALAGFLIVLVRQHPQMIQPALLVVELPRRLLADTIAAMDTLPDGPRH